MPKFLKIILYPIIFAVSLLLFSVVLFPFDSLKNRVATEIEGAMGGGYQVTIGKLSPSLPSGAVLKSVEEPEEPDLLTADVLAAAAEVQRIVGQATME